MKLSVSIVNYNDGELITGLLDSVYSSEADFDYEVIVTDNGSTDGSAEMIESKYPEAKLIRNGENLGFARAQNAGIGASIGEYILLLNPDATIERRAMKRLVSFMDSHEEAGAAGGKILNPDGSIQLSGKKFPTPLTALFLTLGIHKLFPNNPVTKGYYMSEESYDQAQEVDHVMGSFLIARRAAISTAGLMDENFFLYCDDVDWCMRIKQEGYKIFYTPDAVMTHKKGGTTSRDSRRCIIEHHRSLWYFYRKWYYKKYPRLISMLYFTGLQIRKWVYLAINAVSTEKKVIY